MKILKILSIDASSTCTGYTKYELNTQTNSIKHILTSSIKASNKNIYIRYDIIHKEFIKYGLYTWPDVVVFENYAFNGNKVTQLAELNGVLKYNFTLNNVLIQTVAPTTIKAKVSGSGRSNKPEVRKALNNLDLFKDYKFNNNDESDSAAVGYTYIIKVLEESNNAKLNN